MILLVTCVLSALACGVYIRLAKRWQLLDVPNDRSSHESPTPRGGGLPLMLVFFVGVWAFFGPAVLFHSGYGVVLAGAMFLAVVGVLDDVWSLSIKLRFVAYGLCCVVVAATLLWSSGSGAGVKYITLSLAVAFALLWLLNLYNFMDGTDGIAASQCILACFGVALIVGVGNHERYVNFCLLLGFSHLGFLLWNWPKARLFMGDAGSISTGFVLACVAVLGAVEGVLSVECWLILLAVFITDATYTLCWRMFTGQKYTQPHRLHAYQRLSRYWESHSAVLFLFIAIFWLWLFPLAWLSHVKPELTLALLLLTYLPLIFGVVRVGRLEQR